MVLQLSVGPVVAGVNPSSFLERSPDKLFESLALGISEYPGLYFFGLAVLNPNHPRFANSATPKPLALPPMLVALLATDISFIDLDRAVKLVEFLLERCPNPMIEIIPSGTLGDPKLAMELET